ncbi:MAG: helix-turn-helix domain-containing protein [Dehalococcoidales bacterium]|nr:helix-turn-helix domain-containing protein [Dehalococcoidales bacterium]
MNRNKQIGAKIKVARLELGMSQRELGKLYGSSDVTISDMERGDREANVEALERLAHILGKPLEWFLKDDAKNIVRPPQAALADLEVSIQAYIPVYADISAGSGVEPIDYVACTRAKPAPESYRAYRVKGLCLEPDVHDGDTVIVDTAIQPNPGDLVIGIIDGVASIKKYVVTKNDRYLQNNYGKYKPEDVYIHGVVVDLNRKMRKG